MTRLVPGSAVVYMGQPIFLLVIHERTPRQRRRRTARVRAKHVKYQNAMTPPGGQIITSIFPGPGQVQTAFRSKFRSKSWTRNSFVFSTRCS